MKGIGDGEGWGSDDGILDDEEGKSRWSMERWSLNGYHEVNEE